MKFLAGTFYNIVGSFKRLCLNHLKVSQITQSNLDLTICVIYHMAICVQVCYVMLKTQRISVYDLAKYSVWWILINLKIELE